MVVAAEFLAGGFGFALQGRGAEEAFKACAGDFRATFVVDVLLVVVEEGVFFVGESVGFEVDGEGVGGWWGDVGEGLGGFAFVDGGGEVEGVGVAFLFSGLGVSIVLGSCGGLEDSPFAFWVFLACLFDVVVAEDETIPSI